MVMPSSVAAHLSIRLGFRGPSITYAQACAAGGHAIGEALWLLRNRRADLVIAGGADAMLVPSIVSYFARLGALARDTSDPALSSRPFDIDRSGFVMAEGATFVVMVRASDTTSALGHVMGFGASSDAGSLVAPDPTGRAAISAMTQALGDAEISAKDVGVISAHGTSTTSNDLAEGSAIRAVFERCHPMITAPKGATGHMIGASGAFEAAALLESLRQGRVPPIVGLRTADPAFGPLNLVMGAEQQTVADFGLSNSFAFGGHNVALVLGK
jgi:3-oxoacyl-[acyl-carrier-protein] synthase II